MRTQEVLNGFKCWPHGSISVYLAFPFSLFGFTSKHKKVQEYPLSCVGNISKCEDAQRNQLICIRSRSGQLLFWGNQIFGWCEDVIIFIGAALYLLTSNSRHTDSNPEAVSHSHLSYEMEPQWGLEGSPSTCRYPFPRPTCSQLSPWVGHGQPASHKHRCGNPKFRNTFNSSDKLKGKLERGTYIELFHSLGVSSESKSDQSSCLLQTGSSSESW